MKILLTGASGFIGRRLRTVLQDAGHDVVCAGRSTLPGCSLVEVDFAAAARPPWAIHLQGVDAVVNAVGIFREHGHARFERLHTVAPAALFDACVAAGVARVVQVSALGAAADAETAFLRSKHAADAHLLALPLDSTVVQPSLVYGPGGASARGLLALAALPLLPLPAGGGQPVQPVHLDDAVAAIRALLEAPPGRWRGRRVALVGPAPLTLRAYLLALRRGLGLGGVATLPVPRWLVDAAARVGDRLPSALLDRAAWRMLQRGSTASAEDIGTLLGRPPRRPDAFIGRDEAPALRLQAQLAWLLPVLRLSLAAVWLLTGIVSLGLYPVADSHALLARAGVPEALRPMALIGAALLDLALGVATLLPLRHRHWLWLAQALLIVGYTAIITLRLPEFWLHPYGPLSKNLPMLAVLWLLWTIDRRPVATPRA